MKHVHTHGFKPSEWIQAKFESILANPFARAAVVERLGFKTTREENREVIIGACPISPDHKSTKRNPANPVVLPPRSTDFFCSGGESEKRHQFNIRQLILSQIPEAQLEDFLRRKSKPGEALAGIGPDPELTRHYVFEHGEDRAVGTHPQKTVDQLRFDDDVTHIGGVLIEARNMDVARQLAGQIHDKLPWNDRVKLDRDLKLRHPATWHGHWATNQERVLQQEADQRDHNWRVRRYEADVKAFEQIRRAELGLLK